MSDYLQNLVARSLNPSGGVRPRLASRFEPRAAAFAPPASDSFDIAEAEAEPRTPKTNEARRDETRPHAPSTDSRRPQREAAPASTHPPAFNASGRPDEDRTAEARAGRHADEDDAPRASRQPPGESGPTPAAPLREDVRKHASHAEQTGRANEPARDAPPPAASERANAPHAAEPRVAQAPAPRVVEPRVQPAPEAPQAPRPRPSEEGSQREAAPTIRVTIGRVDVRAVANAPQEKRRAPEQPRPALTLEEYLRRRGGGRR